MKTCSDNNPNKCGQCELHQTNVGWCKLFVHEPKGECYNKAMPPASLGVVKHDSKPFAEFR